MKRKKAPPRVVSIDNEELLSKEQLKKIRLVFYLITLSSNKSSVFHKGGRIFSQLVSDISCIVFLFCGIYILTECVLNEVMNTSDRGCTNSRLCELVPILNSYPFLLKLGCS